MDSSFSPKDEILFLRVCHHISNAVYNGYWVFPGGKTRPGRDADPSLPSSAEAKNRVKLYRYSLQGPSWPMEGWNLLITYLLKEAESFLRI